jgi:4-diphosphocytidyl-2-C-methyl-D-erythritol kinase
VLSELAPAKINLNLFLGPTRADGRHELVSVMQSITLADTLTMADTDAPGDEVRCEGVAGPNLAAAALGAFRERTGWDGPAQLLEIVKRVPIAAGMGGGSGDAAAALRLISRRSGLGDQAMLEEIAAGLGADVPAQVRPGRVLATGAGEQLERLSDPEPFGVLVLPSAFALSTAAVYAQADSMGLAHNEQELREILVRVLSGDALAINELTPAAIALEPSIEAALAHASSLGAHTALLSGSGPTALGLFDTLGAAEDAARRSVSLGVRALAAAPIEASLGHN